MEGETLPRDRLQQQQSYSSNSPPISQDGDRQVHRSACSECQRRKQRCNRQWPCDHCQKRKVADQCQFAGDKPETKRKRRANHDDEEATDTVAQTNKSDIGFEAIGYMASTTQLFARLGIESKNKSLADQYYLKPGTNAQLDRLLAILPSAEHISFFVQSFFNTVNNHYYILYLHAFDTELKSWLQKRAEGKELPMQWTCLLFMVLACSAQQMDGKRTRQIESQLGKSLAEVSEEFHTASRDLSSAIPVGRYHFYNVQRLLHSCYWYKAEAKFLECWHVLSAAVREAQELGLHRKDTVNALPPFEKEMHRRVWCILFTWDWQVSSGLGRPTIIGRTDCSAELPDLTFEGQYPSPLLHVKLQCEVINTLAARFVTPSAVVTPGEVSEYIATMEAWMRDFPPVFALEDPDTSLDTSNEWIRLHRYYLYTMSYLMILNPLRAHITKPVTADSTELELRLRAEGISYCLKAMDALEAWIRIVTHRDGMFHFLVFSILDTVAVLCTAVCEDIDHSLPNREQIFQSIDMGLQQLRFLTGVSSAANPSYELLSQLVQKVPRPAPESRQSQRKRAKVTEAPQPSASAIAPDYQSYDPVPLGSDLKSDSISATETSPPHMSGTDTSSIYRGSPATHVSSSSVSYASPPEGVPLSYMGPEAAAMMYNPANNALVGDFIPAYPGIMTATAPGIVPTSGYDQHSAMQHQVNFVDSNFHPMNPGVVPNADFAWDPYVWDNMQPNQSYNHSS